MYIADNRLTILPTWMYHKERFNELYIGLGRNYFYRIPHNNWTRTKREDFEIFTVPSLFATVANFIVSERYVNNFKLCIFFVSELGIYAHIVWCFE